MMRDERYRDGATVRQRRLLTICQLIEERENTDDPMTTDHLCTIMTLVDGLTRQRTQQYVRELSLAAVIAEEDRKSTRLNSSHGYISYAVFCLKKKNNKQTKN